MLIFGFFNENNIVILAFLKWFDENCLLLREKSTAIVFQLSNGFAKTC